MVSALSNIWLQTYLGYRARFYWSIADCVHSQRCDGAGFHDARVRVPGRLLPLTLT